MIIINLNLNFFLWYIFIKILYSKILNSKMIDKIMESKINYQPDLVVQATSEYY